MFCFKTTLSLLLVAFAPAISWAESRSATPNAPLLVDQSSHVVVMEYEAWFGPKAVTFEGTAAKPKLQSADMQPVGGGYDSADPAVIQQHVAWLEYMGVDAAEIEVTNNVACIFNSQAFVDRYVRNCTHAFRIANQVIRNNTGNLYAVWSKLGTPLKLIPTMGGIDGNVLIKDVDGKTALEKEIEYFGARMREHPALNLIYEGKPLMLIFLGAAQDPDTSHNPLWFRIRNFLKNHPELERQYTFHMMAGYLDSQPDLWATPTPPRGPVEIKPAYHFWSWVDRLNISCSAAPCPYYPSYNRLRYRYSSRVENFTPSIATAGSETGWGCPNPDSLPYCSDDSLRFDDQRAYATLDAFMRYARQLNPIFLILHQFNEFVPSDEGFDANTDDDVEPANLWGFGGLNAVRAEILRYRQQARGAIGMWTIDQIP